MLALRLAFANLKKEKSSAVTLTFLILLAALFMNLGFTFKYEISNFYMDKEEELFGPQFLAMTSNNLYKKSYEEFLFQDERVKIAEKEEAVYMQSSKNNRNTLELGAVIFNCDSNRKIAPFQLIEEDTAAAADKAIYVPITLKQYGVKLGEEYILTYKETDYPFQVAGFFETTCMGGVYSGFLKYYVPEETYRSLYEEVGRATILSARFKASKEEVRDTGLQFKNEFIEATNFYGNAKDWRGASCISSAEMEESSISILKLLAALLIAFSVLMCIISMIVVYCRVAETIDDNMQNIGGLQAIGYTTKQIMVSIIMEFGLPGVTGAVLGSAAAYGVMPFVGEIISGISGLIWKSKLHVTADVICSLLIILFIIAGAFAGSMKIRKLPPIIALRKGVGTHHFSKNYFALGRGAGTLQLRLALKNLFMNRKQNIIFAFIIAGGTFVISFTMIMYVNFGFDQSAMIKMSGFEVVDLQIEATAQTDVKELADELQQMEGVRKTNLCDMVMYKVDGIDVQSHVFEQFDALEVFQLNEGEFPKYDNEIVVTAVVAKELHKGIGDMVQVTADGKTRMYTITGLSQTTNNNGKMAVIHLDGIKKLRPAYRLSKVDVYLEDGVTSEQMIGELEQRYKIADQDSKISTNTEHGRYQAAIDKAEEKISKMLEDYGVNSVNYAVMLDGKIILSGDSSAYKIQKIEELGKFLEGQLDSYAGMMAGIMLMTVVSSLLMIGAILTIMIKSLIRKKREEYGIYKAVGYTTFEIMRQVSLSFVFASVIGTIVGGIASACTINLILGVFFESIGISNLKFDINALLIILAAVGIMLFVYGTAMWKAFKIKKVTVYELLTE